MDATSVVAWSREALRLALMLGGPPLLAALAVGLLVGIVQTLTQMHEPVVAQVPRQAAVLVAILAVLPWMIGYWVAYTTDLITSLPEWMVRGY
jgi:flagellar biosynthesis protein FliQ